MSARLTERGAPLAERLDARLDKTGDCWLWTGSRTAKGYGTIHVGGREGQTLYVHRLQYERHVGPIPDGLYLDHLCRVRHCGNPSHLEPVTNRQNVLRGAGSNVQAHNEGRCVRGHDASESVRRRSTGRVVYCKACRREKRREAAA